MYNVNAQRPKLNVIQFLLFETGTYDTQFRRPLTSSMDASHISRVQEATHYGKNLSSAALSGVASDILMPSTSIESSLNIQNGWDTRRYHYVIELGSGDTQYGAFRKILTGYTDTADRSFTGKLDPHMCLYINSHMTLRDVKQIGPRGPVMVSNVVSNDHILTGSYSRSMTGHNEHTLRPTDVLRRLGTDRMLSEQNDGSVDFNMLTTFATGIKNSARKNNNGGVYLSRLLTAYTQSEQTADQYLDSPVAAFDQAAAVVDETRFNDDAIFSIINRITDFGERGFITLMELEGMCPGVEDRATLHVHGGVHAKRQMTTAGTTAGWQGNDLETVLATKVSHALPGLLLDNALNKMSLVMSNLTVDGSYDVRPVNGTIGSIITGINVIEMAERVKIRIIHELMPGLTRNGLVGIFIKVDCDTLSETRITVTVEGGHPVEFVSPTFADALFTPIITARTETVDRLVNDIDNLSSNLGLSSNLSRTPTRTYQSSEPMGNSAAPSFDIGVGSRFL